MFNSLVFALGALSGLGGVALEEDLQLERVTDGGDNEVSHLMKTGVRAVTVIDTKTNYVLFNESTQQCVMCLRHSDGNVTLYFSNNMVSPCRLLGCR